MSLDIVRKNSGSPFHLQRSMVDQGGAGGTYEEGGWNPNALYDDSSISTAIIGFGTMLGAGLESASEEVKNKTKDKTIVSGKGTRLGKGRFVDPNKKITKKDPKKYYNDFLPND